nr:hypothetical protein [Tanacetum cinerariifolium]
MSGIIPPIPPPPGTGTSNPGSPNANRGGSHVTNVLEFNKDDFTSWKIRFLVFLDDLEPYLITTLEDGPFVPMSNLSTLANPLPKRQNQWSNAESRHSNTRDTKIAALRLKFNAFKALEVEKVNDTYNRLKCLLNDLENNEVIISQFEDSDSDVEEDNRTNNEFMVDLNGEYQEKAMMANQKRFYKRSEREEGTTKLKAFIAIAKDEPSMGKEDARSAQWVEIIMKMVHKLLSMTEGDERKHVLDYTHVDLIYVEDQIKDLVNMFNALKQDLAHHKSELSLGEKGSRKENNSPKEVLFTKADVSTSESAPIITSNSKDDCDNQEPLPPLPKLTEAEPSGGLKNLISLSGLTTNMTNLTLNTAFKKTKKSSNKVSQTYDIKKKTEPKHPTVQI